MENFRPSQNPLPTLDTLGVSAPENVDANKVATEWLQSFSKHAENGSTDDILNLFIQESYWRDILALTWDFRTFEGASRIRKFLTDRLPSAKLKAFKLKNEHTSYQQLFPDLVWVQALFDFETEAGFALGIVRIVPTSSGEWKAHSIFTHLEGLKGFPEKIGALRNHESNHGKWAEQRRRENEFADSDPTVLIIGGGQSGLDVAARLKCLEVPSLIIERNERVGDNWRSRYEALCLHDPVWYDHMPYLPFPPTWPVFSPSLKLADWLESYAKNMELNIWLSSTVTSAAPDESNKWIVKVSRADGTERVFKVNHVVFATGVGGGAPNMPKYPGMDEFNGEILHSMQHKKARNYIGKKVVVVGACTSAHDIAVDFYEHGVDITMFQRSSTYVMTTKNGFKILFDGLYSETAPPTDIADRLNASFPNFMQYGLAKRAAKAIAEADKELLEALNKVGFRTNDGYDGTGFFLLAWGRAGGYYLDVGGSQLIADGKIKLKSDSPISKFTETGIEFENGSEIPADVVIFATGLGDGRETVRKICGDAVAGKFGPIWGANAEGELNGVWREVGVPGLWYMMGNLALCRFHSMHIALQIKAIEEGVFGTRYSL